MFRFMLFASSALSVSSRATLVACSKSDSPNKGASETPDKKAALACAPELRVCVGDTVLTEFGYGDPTWQKITEIVPAGSLSRGEWHTVEYYQDREERENAVEAERFFREQSQSKGLRIFVEHNPWHTGQLKDIFASTGCFKPGQLCVGEKKSYQQTYPYPSEVVMEIIGVSIDPEAAAPLWVRKTALKDGQISYEKSKDFATP